jgi:lambda family phage portal protein
VQCIDPDRLSNPQLRFDDQTNRGGVVVDPYGVTTGYHIRRAHQGDWFSAAKSMTWDMIPRETPWGRPIIVHFYDVGRAGQHRGGAGVMTPVLQRLKMLIKYDGTELDAAIVNAILAAYIESPFDPEMASSMLGDDDSVGRYQEGRSDFHNERRVRLNGLAMPTLYPGEKINFVNAARPTSNFPDFEAAILRNFAAGVGSSYEDISRDYSKSNYSSARAANINVGRTMQRRQRNFGKIFMGQIRCALLEEAHDMHAPPLPADAPDFIECRGEYCRADWVGPALGWVDPVKEIQAAILRIEAGLSTLENECAQQGFNYDDILGQRMAEILDLRERGLPLPNWAKMTVDYDDKPDSEAGGAPS